VVVVRDAESGEESVRDAADFQRVSLGDVHACPQRILTLPAQVADGELLHSVQRLACLLARPNVTYDPAQSAIRSESSRQQAMSAARGRSVRTVREGEVLVRAGQQITPTIHRRLQTMAATRPDSSSVNWSWVPVAVYTLAMLLALALIGRRWLGRQLRPKDELMLLTILAFQLMSTSLVKSLSPLWIEPGEAGSGGAVLGWSLLVPFMGAPMLVRLFRPLESAVFVAIAYSALAVPLLGVQPGVELMHVLGGITAAVMIGQGRLRRDTVVAPAVALVVACLPVIGIMTVAGTGGALPDVSSLLWVLCASLAINTAVAVLPQPLIEGLFGMTSAARLKELGQEHALLDQLARQAGGTYSHSRMVGELCRAGCDAIGANGLLAEVGARFHDIGKLKRPEYFAENQVGVNVHDGLEPIQSAAILREHVTYGIELAISYGLPEEIIAFIREHHGTKLMGFYGKALKQGEAFEADFRYEGPRPSSRETALCLLADGIEAESRSKPRDLINESYIRQLIKRHIRDAVSDDQLVESGLSVRDLARVADAFFHSMATELLQKRPQYDPLPTLDASDQLKVGRITATSDQPAVRPHS
jgi:putative nucleotidyltransferase with HDIG domain